MLLLQKGIYACFVLRVFLPVFWIRGKKNPRLVGQGFKNEI
jgi:hypothetical protein